MLKTRLSFVLATTIFLLHFSKAFNVVNSSECYEAYCYNEEDDFEVINALSKKHKTFSTELVNRENKGYYLTLNLGNFTTNQPFTVLVDIGTADTWLADANCTNCYHSNVFPSAYDCSSSDTCNVNYNKINKIEYPKGETWGSPSHELMIISGMPYESPLNHTFTLSRNITKSFYNISADGVFGLGLTDKTNEDSFLSTLKNKDLISKEAFSLFLTENLYGQDSSSRIIFGGFEQEYMLNPSTYFQFAEVVEDHAWAIQLNTLTIGKQKISIEPAHAMLSTVFKEIGVPKDVLIKILDSFNKQGFLCEMVDGHYRPRCSCSVEDYSKFPNLTITVRESQHKKHSVELQIPPSVYIGFKHDNTHLSHQEDDEEHYSCMINIEAIDTDDFNQNLTGKWILGASFLRQYYTYFDKSNHQIGFTYANNQLQKTFPYYLIQVFMGVATLLVIGLIFSFLFTCRKVGIEIENNPQMAIEQIKTKYQPRKSVSARKSVVQMQAKKQE